MPSSPDHRQPVRRATIAAAAIIVLACATGCARTRIATPLATDYPPDDAVQELAFWHQLPSRSAVSNDEGFHGLILLADGRDPSGSYDARVALLKAKGWLPDSFDEPGDLAMQRGRLASLVVQMLEIRGGVMMNVFGPTPRYATRELAYIGLIPPFSSELQAINGLEYMGVISKAQDFAVLRDFKALPPEDQANPPAPGEPAAAPTADPATPGPDSPARDRPAAPPQPTP